MVSKRIMKFTDGGELTTNPPKGNITVDQWNALKQKYAGNLPKIGKQGALDQRMDWVQWANQKLPTSGTPAELAKKAAQVTGFKDPGLILSSSMEEGVGMRFKGDEAYSQAYDDAKINQKQFPVDGFRAYGLDQIGARVDEFIKKGYLPKDFKSKMMPFSAANEQDDKEYYTQVAKLAQQNGLVDKNFKFDTKPDVYEKLDSAVKGYKGQLPVRKKSASTAAFVDDESAYVAKAAFMRAEQDNVINYAKQKGYNLTPEEQNFFMLSSYNGGAGNGQKMMDYYGSKKELGNNAFLKDRMANKGQIYDNVLPRYAGAQLFNKEGYFKEGGRIQYGNGTPDPITGKEPVPQLQGGSSMWNTSFNAPQTVQAPDEIFRIDNNGKQIKTAPNSIVPLSQYYDKVNDPYGNTLLQGTGKYMDANGSFNTLEAQQLENNKISSQNLDNALQKQNQLGDIEKGASIGMSAINAFFNKRSDAKNGRIDSRNSILSQQDSNKLNPYLQGNGSQAIMEKGGRMKYETGGQVAKGIDLNITDGGKYEQISSSDHSNPMIEFKGKEHKEGGIGIQFGGNIAEVEDKEVGWVDGQGGLNVFGKLKVPGTGKTFKNLAKDIAKEESDTDKLKSKYLTILNQSNPADPYHQSATSTAKVMFKSLDKKSKEIAEKKEGLASYQNLILNMSKSNVKDLDKDGDAGKDTDGDKYEFGGRMEMAEGGKLDPNDPASIQAIIDKYSGGKSPLKAQDFIEVSAKYGIPVDLMLAQAIQESSIGTKGMAVRTKNIFNVGNNGNTGKTTDQGDFKAGLERYAKLIKNDYSVDGKVDVNYLLSSNFKRPKKGGNYAEESDYGKNITRVLNEINPNGGYVLGDNNPPANTSTDKTPASTTDNTPVTPTPDLTNFKPVFQPLATNKVNPIDTPHGAAYKQGSALSDKAVIASGSRVRGNLSPLALEQIAPELLTMATNKKTPVTQETYQPDLKQTFDTSFQLGRNENQSTFNQMAQLAAQTGNMDALSQMAAQKYQADQQYNMQEVQGNAANKLQTYNGNIDLMNDARLRNLAGLADQRTKQAQADFNTRSENMAAFASMTSKDMQNKLENKTYNAYANLFQHYGFDKKGNVTFDPGQVVQKFDANQAQQFGLMAAKEGVDKIIKKTDAKGDESTTTVDNSDLDDLAKARRALKAGASYSDIIEAMPKLSKYKSLQDPQ